VQVTKEKGKGKTGENLPDGNAGTKE